MFTGIVSQSLPLIMIENLPGLTRIAFNFSEALLQDLTIGASVAIDGVCLTVTHIEGRQVQFDIMRQTLEVTTLQDLQSGQRVNIERSAKQGAEVGGHIVSGHVDGYAEVVGIEQSENNHYVIYQVPAHITKYIFDKGFVALNGCSLTVAKLDRAQNTLTVCYIPETLRVTTHGDKKVGDKVNIEVDRQTQTIVDTVERVLAERG